jgi:hypothetical protein
MQIAFKIRCNIVCKYMKATKGRTKKLVHITGSLFSLLIHTTELTWLNVF